MIDCEVSECEVTSLVDRYCILIVGKYVVIISRSEVRGMKTKWFGFDVASVENLVVGIPPLYYTAEEGVIVNKQPTSIPFKFFNFNFKKISGNDVFVPLCDVV